MESTQIFTQAKCETIIELAPGIKKAQMIANKLNIHSKLKNDEELRVKLIRNLLTACQKSLFEHALEDQEDLTQWERFCDWLKTQERTAKYTCRSHTLANNAVTKEQPGGQESVQSRLH